MTEPESELAHLDEETRSAAQSNTMRVLFGSVAVSRAGTTISFVVAAILIRDMLGDATWAGASTVAVTVGTASSAAFLSQLMNKRGRRPGLALGFGLGAVGGLIGLVGAQISNIPIFLVGMVLVGVGSGAGNLARYASADLAPAASKSKSISFIVWASTIGAVVGPTLVGVMNRVGDNLGLNNNVGPFVLTLAAYALASVIVLAWLRPDPLVLADGLDKPGGPPKASFTTSLGIIRERPMARLALASLVTSQAVMVGVMAMTPLHMKAHGHDESVVGYVLSAHVLGMFGFAPIAGYLADKLGRLPAIGLGAATLVSATVLTALATSASNALMFPGLFLLGLGWSLGMVAGSSLLSQSVDANDRVSVQGAADVLANSVSGGAALSSGLVLSMTGFHVLSMIGIVAAGLLFVATVIRQRLSSATASPA